MQKHQRGRCIAYLLHPETIYVREAPDRDSTPTEACADAEKE